MRDLADEKQRVLLMAEAGCDARCGLTWSTPRDGGEPTLSHHRHDVAVGKSEHTEVATIYVMPENFDLAAWIAGQHTEPDDA